MKRNFNVVVKDLEDRPHLRQVMKYDKDTGMPVMEEVQGRKVHAFDRFEPMTLRQYALDALCGRWSGEDKAPWDQVKKRGELIDRITFSQDGWVELENADCQIIKDALEHSGATYYVMYRMGKMLETDPPAAPAAAGAPGADAAAPAASSAPNE